MPGEGRENICLSSKLIQCVRNAVNVLITLLFTTREKESSVKNDIGGKYIREIRCNRAGS